MKLFIILCAAIAIVAATTSANAETVTLSSSPVTFEVTGTDRVISLSDSGKCYLDVITYRVDNGEIKDYLSDISVPMREGDPATITASGGIGGIPSIVVACNDGRLTVISSPFPEIEL